MTVTEDAGGGTMEIANGLTGVRVPLKPTGMNAAPSPVLAVRTRSGVWLPAGPFQSPQFKSVQTKFLEHGPLATRVAVACTFVPSAAGDSTTASREPYCTCTIQLQAGEPVVVFEEESNVEVSHEIRLDAVKPTQGRYRGNSSTSVERGREADGRQYRPWHDRPPLDAFESLRKP